MFRSIQALICFVLFLVQKTVFEVSRIQAHFYQTQIIILCHSQKIDSNRITGNTTIV